MTPILGTGLLLGTGLPLGLGNVRVERDPAPGAYANITEPEHLFHEPRGGGYVITPADRRYPIHASGVGKFPEIVVTWRRMRQRDVLFCPESLRLPPQS
jgi:hypothetical protein